MNQLQYLMDICREVAISTDYDHLLDHILNIAMDIAHCDAGTLYLTEGNYLTFALMKNRSRADLNGQNPEMPAVPIHSENHMCTLALNKGIIRIDDAYACKEYDIHGTYVYDQSTKYHTQSVMMVPIQTREGERIGVLQLINCLEKETGAVCAFSENDEQITEALASQVSVVLQNAISQNKVKMLQKSIQELAKAESIPENIRIGLSEYMTSHLDQKKEKDLSLYLGSTTMETASKLNVYTNSLANSVRTLDLLQKYLWESELSNSELGKRANMNKGTFSSIVNGKRKITRENLIPLCIALRLSLAETEEILATMGYIFRESEQRDLVIRYFLELNETAIHPYWVPDINDVLFEMGLASLGSQIK